MGRPSLKIQRMDEILDAFEICVARHGLEGATLDKLADQAGLARPLIRHYVGNRQDLIDALIDRFMDKSADYTRLLIIDLPGNGRFSAFIDRLFDAKYFDANLVLVTEALIAGAGQRPDLALQIKKMVASLINVIGDELQLEFNHARPQAVKTVATGILGIYFNADSLSLLGDMEDFRLTSKRSAIRLANSLAE